MLKKPIIVIFRSFQREKIHLLPNFFLHLCLVNPSLELNGWPGVICKHTAYLPPAGGMCMPGPATPPAASTGEAPLPERGRRGRPPPSPSALGSAGTRRQRLRAERDQTLGGADPQNHTHSLTQYPGGGSQSALGPLPLLVRPMGSQTGSKLAVLWAAGHEAPACLGQGPCQPHMPTLPPLSGPWEWLAML